MMKNLVKKMTVALAAAIMTLTAVTATASACEEFGGVYEVKYIECVQEFEEDGVVYYVITDEEVVEYVAAPSYEVISVVYPRVDRQLACWYGTTWCSLNTDGYYYNEVGARFEDLGNGYFADVYGNVMVVLQ